MLAKEEQLFLNSLAKYLASEVKTGAELFFRLDDFAKSNDRAYQLMKIFKQFNIPITLAIIPNDLDDILVQFLKKEKEKSNIDLIIHGYKHHNYNDNLLGSKSEWGNNRSEDEIMQDIKSAIQIMNMKFGNLWSSIFCPPWNTISPKAQSIINELGFNKISTSRSDVVNTIEVLQDVPVAVDLISKKKTDRYSQFKQVILEIKDCDRLGIMIHYDQLSPADLIFLTEVLKTLINSNKLSFAMLKDLYD